MRPPVDRDRIEAFLVALGRAVRHPVRFYLVGGTTVVWLHLRAQTIDIDFTAMMDPKVHGEFIDAVRRLKDEMKINVEEVSPADFIPLPSGHEQRAIWVGRYGTIDVFHFDLVSTALSKIERGTAGDFEDVVELVRYGELKREELRRGYEEILPRMGRESLKQDPDRLKRNFAAYEKRLGPDLKTP
jgi:hypothetical protein